MNKNQIVSSVPTFAPIFNLSDGFTETAIPTVKQLMEEEGMERAEAVEYRKKLLAEQSATVDVLAGKPTANANLAGIALPPNVGIRIPGVGLVVATEADGELCQATFTGAMRFSTARENPDTGKMESTLQLEIQFVKATMPKKLAGLNKRFVNATEGYVVETPQGEYTTNIPVGKKLELQYRAGDVNGTNRAWFTML